MQWSGLGASWGRCGGFEAQQGLLWHAGMASLAAAGNGNDAVERLGGRVGGELGPLRRVRSTAGPAVARRAGFLGGGRELGRGNLEAVLFYGG